VYYVYDVYNKKWGADFSSAITIANTPIDLKLTTELIRSLRKVACDLLLTASTSSANIRPSGRKTYVSSETCVLYTCISDRPTYLVSVHADQESLQYRAIQSSEAALACGSRGVRFRNKCDRATVIFTWEIDNNNGK